MKYIYFVGISSRDRQLLKLAIPALGALLAEPLHVLADTAVVGHLGTSALGGLGVSSSALLLIYGYVFFLLMEQQRLWRDLPVQVKQEKQRVK